MLQSLVGGNLDKHVTSRDMRLDSQAQSLHYFNCYAVKDRLSTVDLEDQPSLPDFSFSEAKILPTAADHEVLFNNNIMVVLVSRVVKNFSYFSKFGVGVPKRINRSYVISALRITLRVYGTPSVTKYIT